MIPLGKQFLPKVFIHRNQQLINDFLGNDKVVICDKSYKQNDILLNKPIIPYHLVID